MNIPIFKGIQLPIFDVEMLSLGKIIVVPFNQHLPGNKALWVYPSQHLPFDLTLEQYYKPDYLDAAKTLLAKHSILSTQVKTWGLSRCHWQIHSNNRHLLLNIAQSTIWKLEALEHIFEQNQVLRLLFLKAHRFPKPCVVNEVPQSGSFFWFQPKDEVISANEQDATVVSEASFNQRKALLMSGEVYSHSSLETLNFQVEEFSISCLEARQLSHDIKQLLGWTTSHSSVQKPEWINEIASRGNRSIQEDDGTSNYHAGTLFEIIARQSLEFLGFKVDYSHKGGAGGLDLFCSKPFPLVGECKSGKKIPNDTAVQLLNLGTIRLQSKEELSQAVKLIIGPGEPTEQLKKAAEVHSMTIINPSTLEKLVKLRQKHPVDLLKLKNYLVDGQADEEVARFIEETEQTVELRASILQLVKNYLENANAGDASIYELHAVYVVSKPVQPLNNKEMHEILIELSSPLIGYLGRRKDNSGDDRFYFLRDLIVD